MAWYNRNNYAVSEKVVIFQGPSLEVNSSIREWTDREWKILWTDLKVVKDDGTIVVLVAFA